MTTTLDVAPTAPAEAGIAITALARQEVRIFLQSVWVWGGAVLALALCTVWGWTTEPIWDGFTANAGMASLVLTGFVLLVAHLASSRDHRSGAAEVSATLPATARRRTIALLALVPAAGLVGAVTVAVELVALGESQPVGVFDPWTSLITLVLPMSGAAIGVAAGRLLPSTAAGPLTVFTCAAALAMLPIFGSGAGDLPWLLFPVVLDENVAPGFPRPTGWHLLYLLALLAAVIAVAMLRHKRLLPAVALIAALAMGTIAVQRQQEERATAGAATASYLGPEAQQCERHDRVSYCPLPGYGRWVPLWRASVEPVVSAVPASAGELPSVRQGIGPESSAVAGLRWGRHGGWAEDSRIGLTQEYVRVLLGLPDWESGQPGPGALTEQNRGPWPTGSVQLGRGPTCSGSEQLRTVIALYLIAQADPGNRWLLGGDGGRVEIGQVQFGAPEREAATKLLDAPRDQVQAFLAAKWSTILTPAPAGGTLAPFGVPDLPATTTNGGGPACQ